MKADTTAIELAQVQEHCRVLRLPTVAAECGRASEAASRNGRTCIQFLNELLFAEVEERDTGAVARRLKEARFPRQKTLDEFDFSKATQVSPSLIKGLAAGSYMERGEPVILLGDCGTGKTHLATALCVEACRQRKRVRFTTASGLVNELIEAQHSNQLGRVLGRWARYDLVCIDELGYIPLAELGAELLFQVISDRAEKASIIITTNLPFSEWTKVFTNPRLCKALLDRLTDRAHIIETGSESFRFRRTLDQRKPTSKSVVEALRNTSDQGADA